MGSRIIIVLVHIHIMWADIMRCFVPYKTRTNPPPVRVQDTRKRTCVAGEQRSGRGGLYRARVSSGNHEWFTGLRESAINTTRILVSKSCRLLLLLVVSSYLLYKYDRIKASAEKEKFCTFYKSGEIRKISRRVFIYFLFFFKNKTKKIVFFFLLKTVSFWFENFLNINFFFQLFIICFK